MALRSRGPCTPLAGCACRGLGERQWHGLWPACPPAAQEPDLRRHEVRKRLWPQPSISPPRVARSCHIGSWAVMWRNQHSSWCHGPGGAACPRPGVASGLDAGPGCQRQVPRGTEAAAGPGRLVRSAHREDGATRRVERVRRGLAVSALGEEPCWGHHAEKPLWGMRVLC